MKKPNWDPREFDKIQLPEVIRSFLVRDNIIRVGAPVRCLDMPIRLANCSTSLTLPHSIRTMKGFEWIRSICYEAWDYERCINEDADDHYVYLTIDQKPVLPSYTQRRAGWHSDMFVEGPNGGQIDITPENANFLHAYEGEIDHTYILTDCLPTEFAKIPFPLTDWGNCGHLGNAWNAIGHAAEKGGLIQKYGLGQLLKLTPYVVHRSPINIHPATAERTFIKIAISRKKFNREGNTKNPDLDYDWEMVPRSTERNHPWK